MANSTLKFSVAQKNGSYKKEDKTINSYQDLGVVFENDKGHLSLKLNALPLPNADGEVWLNLFPIKNSK